MPELPEVETIKNDLAPLLVDKRFVSVEVLWPNLVKLPSSEDLQRQLPGHRIASLSRRGKYLVVSLSNHSIAHVAQASPFPTGTRGGPPLSASERGRGERSVPPSSSSTSA